MFTINTISQIHEMIQYEKPKHPLISIIEPAKIERRNMPSMLNQQIVSNLYTISLKNGSECHLNYGRQSYDFQEGSMMFMAPNQAITPISATAQSNNDSWNGWVLLFHPDLIASSPLAEKIREFSFFKYESHEALHVSEKERQTITQIVETIEHEYSQNIDEHSQELIVSNIELLLNYSKRFYGRQFITRTHANKDALTKFELLLDSLFEQDQLKRHGIPTVKFCAEQLGYSKNYLSDLLKKETGKNTQEHIHGFIIEKAKTMLLGTEDPISTIAYALGFEYPQHFSKLFKNKTGVSPAKFRN